jgi:hypothetical protein
MVRMFGAIKRWWHDGEDPHVLRVRRFNWLLQGAIYCGILTFPVVLAELRRQTIREGFLIFLLVMALLMLPRIACERRRAILVYGDSLRYRPVFGPARRVAWDEVRRVERALVLNWRPLAEGLKFTLEDGLEFYLPLDLKQRSEVEEHVKAKLTDRARF